jgi:hypothetical protein
MGNLTMGAFTGKTLFNTAIVGAIALLLDIDPLAVYTLMFATLVLVK